MRIAACLILAAATTTAAQTAPVLERCTHERFEGLVLAQVTVREVAVVQTGSFRTSAAAPPLANLPAFCRVQASVSTSADSLVNFEVWIPNAGTANSSSPVTAATGTCPATATWGMRLRRATLRPAATRAIRPRRPTTCSGARATPSAFSTGEADRSTRSPVRQSGSPCTPQEPQSAARYLYGCSTGGHQAYAEIQRYPGDFDGVVAGAPGNNRVRLNAAFLWQFLANHERGAPAPILPAAKLPVITRAVVAACDGLDGVTDGVIDDPRKCPFDPASLLCKDADAATCLTNAQVAVVKKVYAGAKNPRTGEQVYPGWPPGSEALTSLPDGRPGAGWQQYWGTTEPTRANFWRHWVFERPEFDWWAFDFDRDVQAADEKVGRLVDQVNPDLSAFKAKGGKAIVYQGWQDPVVNALDTISYYEQVRARQGSQARTDEFFRLFLVGGMGHCSGGTGATAFGNQGGPAPVVDSDHDVLAALDAWVEKGVAPSRIIASRVEGGKTVRTRPLCPFPTRPFTPARAARMRRRRSRASSGLGELSN